MPRYLHFTKFFLFSLALHALVVASALFLAEPAPPAPQYTPVRIVNLPQQEVKQLPPLRQPEPARPVPPPSVPRSVVREKPLPPQAVPMPKKFGDSEEVTLPKTSPVSPPAGMPGGAEQGAESGKTGPETGKTGPAPGKQTGPLPFLTQNDIDQLARKGMPARQPGDESVTLDTDEFKFISYNRWLKIKIESMLKYPELAAVSGYQGTLFIKFDILKDGSLGGFEVLKGSGYKILDDEAERAIRSSAPFQPLPDDWGMERYSIRAAVIFYMNTGYIR
ncbi:MAG TPA: TonB family protein [Nitrospirota bacterium]